MSTRPCYRDVVAAAEARGAKRALLRLARWAASMAQKNQHMRSMGDRFYDGVKAGAEIAADEARRRAKALAKRRG